MNLSFASLWEKISDLIPEEDALICGDDVLSWREFDVRASKLASALIENGLSKNSKVAIYLNNSNEYLIAQYAIFKIDGCPINVNYRYVEDELTYLLENSDSEAVFFHSTYSNRIDNIILDLKNYDILLLNPLDPGWDSNNTLQEQYLKIAVQNDWRCKQWENGLELCKKK